MKTVSVKTEIYIHKPQDSAHNIQITKVCYSSLTGLNAQLCSMQLNLPLSELSCINIKHARRLASPADNSYTISVNVIYNLLLVKSNLTDVPILSSTDVDFIIDNPCVLLGLS